MQSSGGQTGTTTFTSRRRQREHGRCRTTGTRGSTWRVGQRRALPRHVETHCMSSAATAPLSPSALNSADICPTISESNFEREETHVLLDARGQHVLLVDDKLVLLAGLGAPVRAVRERVRLSARVGARPDRRNQLLELVRPARRRRRLCPANQR